MTASDPSRPFHPTSPHLSDPSLHAFLSPSFSLTTYLNTILPPPPPSTAPKPTPQQPLSAIVTQTQSQISTLSAQTSRLSATLTALTDDILRRSSRLAYEIELLRGDANALVAALSERGELNDAIRTFIPTGLPHPSPYNNQRAADQKSPSPSTATATAPKPSLSTRPKAKPSPPPPPPPATAAEEKEKEKTNEEEDPTQHSLRHLQTLLSVRTSLQKTAQIFSLALSWPMPPSLILPSTSTAANIISISSPQSQHALAEAEAKGQEALTRLRGEIEQLLEEGGWEKARARVEELRECVGVWRGTGEERARGKWVAEVEGWVEGEVGRGKRRGGGAGAGAGAGAGTDTGGGGERESAQRDEERAGGEELPGRTGSGAGFLRRLRDEIYLE